ncbi:hypothetical protein A0H81_08816 [Grifola frondosa]|uniref:F-box domain-containing protein n=1 Tax=Grifola frondosa TaxID=5627 RepID=A0A1C7M3M9_GRIFR|nr:hypothetical protein A0H81_08816 [Grifola frondosa]
MENKYHARNGLLSESPTATVDLDLDIVYIILSLLSRQDLLRLMSTCRTLNNAAVRHLLNFHVHLNSARKIESFCAFMLAQAPLRYPFLRQLSLGGLDGPVSPESIHQLVKIFTHASRLETLHLTCCDLLKLEHRLRAACSSLTSLKEFHMCWSGGLVSWAKDPLYQMVKQMQSPLVKVILIFFGRIDSIGLDPAVLLHHSSATLEDLEVYHPHSSLSYSFRALTDLTILPYADRSTAADSNQHRQLNRSVQLAGGGWTSLDRLTGCRSISMVADILSDCRPSHVDIVFDQMFPSIPCLSDDVAARPTHLRCALLLRYFDGSPNALDIFQPLLQCESMRGVTFVQQCGPEAIASQIIASYPSIRYIAIEVDCIEPLFWKVLATESGDVVVDKAPKEDISVVMDF